MAMLETPSRILRRIEALEAQDSDLPSLPSLPAFDDSDVQSFQPSSAQSLSPKNQIEDDEDLPFESTPGPVYSHTTRSTMHPPSTSSSATRFANSMRTSMSTIRKNQQDSFEVSKILPARIEEDSSSSASIPDVYLPPDDANTDDLSQIGEEVASHASLSQSGSQARTPHPFVPDNEQQRAPKTHKYDYSVSLRSEPKPSPLSLGRNVSVRKPLSSRARTPSLSRTTPSPTSASSNSTPRSTYSARAQDVLSPPPSVIEPIEIATFHDHTAEDVDDGDDVGSDALQEESLSIEQKIEQSGVAYSQENVQDSSPEPTSSEEHILSSSGSSRVRTPFPNAFSSPLPTNNPTPKPVFAPRTAMQATATPALVRESLADDFATPYNRRRSFLLSLVHSTARPRMTFPTPHPHSQAVPTSRPRAHPLSQAWTPSPSHLDPNSCSNPSSGSSHSPHDHLSFISTASSHDLTVHPRANASFDPATGSKGVGRFNAVKLNTYLHGLNRRLQEENEMLVSRLRIHGEEVEMDKMVNQLEQDGLIVAEKAVLEEVEAMHEELERCEQEKGAFKVETDALLDSLRKEKDEIDRELDTEREARKKDNERWKGRMAEVEEGVEGVIKRLERRLVEAERDAKCKTNAEEKARQFEEKCLSLEDDLHTAKSRAEKAEGALASSSDLGAEVKQAYENAAVHKEEASAAQALAAQLEHKLREVEHRGKQLKISLDADYDDVIAELRDTLEARQSAEAHARELEAEVKAGEERLDELEDELTATQKQTSELLAANEELKVKLEKGDVEAARAAQFARQMEDALEESERKMIADEEELAQLRNKVARMEQEIEGLRERSRDSTPFDKNAGSRERSIPEDITGQLEAELDDAHREIGRLKHLLSESPSRNAIGKAKDVRIELLEKEKDELAERIKALSSALLTSSLNMVANSDEHSPARHRQVLSWRTPKTPGPPLKDLSWLQDKSMLPSTSPLVSQIAHLQQELHLANDSIDEKVNKLEEAGMGIVGLTERLEDARARIAALEGEIGRLMRREERLMRRLERVRCLKCHGRVDHGKLFNTTNMDRSSSDEWSASLVSHPPTPPSKTAEALKVALQTVNSKLGMLRSQWEDERKQLLGENAVLQDAANRLNSELGTAKGEAKRALENGRDELNQEAMARANVEMELEQAREAVADLENALKDERSRLRALSTEQSRVIREKDGILLQLQRAQSDMDDVRAHLEKIKSDNHELEAELRATTAVDQKARLLEAKVSENQNVIEQLRAERDSLAADHGTLQQRYIEASSRINRLREELSISQQSHDERRHQLDLRVNEIEELRRELSEQARELERVESEKNQAKADHSGIVRTVASLESDLKRIRNDAEALGRDLKELKVERDRSEIRHRDELGKADRAQKQLHAQLRVTAEQLDVQREKAKKAIADLQGHVCQLNEHDLEELRVQHRNECKGLMVQIRYLKAKFTRESVFRADLGYQKHYLLGILSSFEKSEKQILAAIARIGFPVTQNQPRPRRPKLRTIAVLALFIAKARRASNVWREQSVSRTAVNAALQDVRRRRIAGSLGYT